jgi:hypothetical protein
MVNQFSLGTTGWRNQVVNFVTGPEARLITIKVMRVPRNPLITGTFWLDHVQLTAVADPPVADLVTRLRDRHPATFIISPFRWRLKRPVMWRNQNSRFPPVGTARPCGNYVLYSPDQSSDEAVRPKLHSFTSNTGSNPNLRNRGEGLPRWKASRDAIDVRLLPSSV